MNPILAEIYGTGLVKEASEVDDEVIDLDSISTDDLINMAIESEDGQEEAGEAIDIDNISTQDLVNIAVESDQEKTAAEEAEDSFADLDHAGRVLAHRIARGEFEGLI